MKAILSLVIAVLFSAQSLAAIPAPYYKFIDDHEELDLNRIGEMQKLLQQLSYVNYDRYLPKKMSRTSDATELAQQILNHNFDLMISEYKKKSAVVRGVASVASGVNQNVSFVSEEGEIEHSLKMQVIPDSIKARVKYEGVVVAQATYAIQSSEFDFEVSKSLQSDTDIVFNYQDNETEVANTVSLRWRF